MESELPLPIPDRRIINNKNYNLTKFNGNENIINYQKEPINKDIKFNELKESKLSTMSMAQMMQMEDMRLKIFSYSLLSDKTIYINSFQNSKSINKCNIIIFGPSGGGKSSFIKSLYRSLYNEPYLPLDLNNNIIIRNKNNNENILLFTQFDLILETEKNSGIMLCDTSGNLKLKNNKKIILDGEKIESKLVEKMANKNQKALLDFWKKPNKLFPKEIFKTLEGNGNIKNLPYSVALVFDGSNEEIIQKKDVNFYKELVEISKDKGYKDIHVILTKLDIFEKNIWEKYKNFPENEIRSKLNSLKDIQIEKIISILEVKRSNIHFIENYHSNNQEKNLAEIDYNILKIIIDMLNTSELFILDKMNKEQNCFGLLCI